MEPDPYEWIHSAKQRVDREGKRWTFMRQETSRFTQRLTGGVLSNGLIIVSMGLVPQDQAGAAKPMPLLIFSVLVLYSAVITIRAWSPRPLVVTWGLWPAILTTSLITVATLFELFVTQR